MKQLFDDIVLVGGNNQLNVQMLPIAVAGIQVKSITLDKTSILAAEAFTITITFSNPNDYDVWVRPKFAFGQLNAEFVAEQVLAGFSWDPETGLYMDPRQKTDWVNLGHPNFRGTNMTQFVYDPEGIPVIMPGRGEGECWLKVPAKGQASTSREWAITSKAFDYGVRDVCVKVENPFYLVYDEGWATRTVGETTVVLNWRPIALEPFSGVAPDIATIGLAPLAVTIDNFEVQFDYVREKLNHKVTLTNTGKTLIKTKLQMRIYAGQRYSHRYRPGTPKIYEVGDSIGEFDQEGLGDIPPGTATLSFASAWSEININYEGDDHKSHRLPMSEGLPEGLKYYVVIRLWQGTQKIWDSNYEVFKGTSSSSWQTWMKPPYTIKKIKLVSERWAASFDAMEVTLLDGSGVKLIYW